MKFTIKRYIDLTNWASERYGINTAKTDLVEIAAWKKYLEENYS